MGSQVKEMDKLKGQEHGEEQVEVCMANEERKNKHRTLSRELIEEIQPTLQGTKIVGFGMEIFGYWIR